MPRVYAVRCVALDTLTTWAYGQHMTTTQAPIKQDQRGWFVRVNDDGSLDNLSGSGPVRLPLITITDPTAIRMAAFLASRR